MEQVVPSLETLKQEIDELKTLQATESKKMAGLKGEEKDAQQAKIKEIKTKLTEKEELLKKHYPEEANTSKAAAKKAQNKKQANQAQGKQPQQQQQQSEQAIDYEKFTCPAGGVLPIHQSAKKDYKTWSRVSSLDATSDNSVVWIRARVQTIRPQGNKLVFFALRQKFHTIQALLSEKEGSQVTRSMLKWAAKIPDESIVNVKGLVVKSPVKIDLTQSDVEVQIHELWLESRSLAEQPIRIADCSRPVKDIKEQKKKIKAIEKRIEEIKSATPADPKTKAANESEVEKLIAEKSRATTFVWPKINTRLDNRVLDLRTTANQAIFRIQSGVGQLFREYLLANNFTEIHTPKLIGTASEGGAAVFQVKYFDGHAYLAQSPQLYKQMAICSDMERVFEVGPVFRAETAFTARHLTEFVGLDLEMQIHDHYHEVVDVIDNMFYFLFHGLETRFASELQAVQAQFPFEPISYRNPSPRLLFSEGMALLKAELVRLNKEIASVQASKASAAPAQLAEIDSRLEELTIQRLNALGPDHTEEINEFEDLSTPQEKLLGALVKAKYGVDFYFLEKYPVAARPFYTMVDPNDERYTNSYDIFIRNEEICSGGQRVHDADMLIKRAESKEVPPASIKDYVDAFRYGAPPHGGGGVGLERVVMLYLNLKNIRRTSLFPRDPARLAP